MKHFLVLINYTVPADQFGENVKLHRDFLQGGYERGWLLMSGPRNPKTCGIAIARAPSQQDLADFFKDDPYRLLGLADHEFIEFDPVKHQPWLSEWING